MQQAERSPAQRSIFKIVNALFGPDVQDDNGELLDSLFSSGAITLNQEKVPAHLVSKTGEKGLEGIIRSLLKLTHQGNDPNSYSEAELQNLVSRLDTETDPDQECPIEPRKLK